MTVNPEEENDLIDLLFNYGITAKSIGTIDEGSKVIVTDGSTSATFIDWRENPVTGIEQVEIV